ncbi:MAG: MFS transporter, partial [Ruminiclostridium sp.]|nr:MFS transporter [Ruminiclostridium sp.]
KRSFLRCYRRMPLFLLGIVCLLVSHNVLNTYAFQIVQPLGGDSGQMGTMLLIQSLVELPVMFLFAWMVSKVSSRFWLRISGIGFFLHALGALLAPNMLTMDIIQIFEMNGYALFTLASIYFVNEMVTEDQRIQGQAWVAMAMTLGNVLASFAGGLLLDWAGVFVLLLFATTAGGAGMAIFWVLLGKESPAFTRKL